jgi:non-ribosomal peptide synthetase-like protein
MDTTTTAEHDPTVPLDMSRPPERRARSTDAPLLLHEVFQGQASRTPTSTAVTCGRTGWTYAELDAKSNQLARYLRARGMGRDSCVGILLPRSSEVYVSMLAVLKAGAAYVPLDPEYPADRVRYILEDSHAELLFTSSSLAERARSFDGEVVLLERLEEVSEGYSAEVVGQDEVEVNPQDLCYVIYTSGTTGRPKGVQIEHRSIAHLVAAEKRLFHIATTDRVFQGFSIAFDASLEEIWLAFAAGATLVVGTKEMLQAGPALAGLLEEAGVSVLSCVPTLLAMLERDVETLRFLILGGEVCPPELVKRWWRAGRRIFNTYGPTEATVIATCTELFPDKPVTIGCPLPGYEAVIVDDRLESAGSGETGELYLAGVGLARGYVGKPELTAERFVTCSFCGSSARRFYRTGDLARCNGAGELEFLGRVDSQVKIRGFRVELSEIEAVLLELNEVKSAAVTVIETEQGIQQLAAYVVPRTAATFDPQQAGAYLKRRLPAYMVPMVFEVIPDLPTSPSGKINRRALPAPRRAATQRIVHPPVGPVEEQLVKTWEKLFCVSAVSATDDFFTDLGGHSLLAAKMVSELRSCSGFEALSMADVYQHSTPATMAGELKRRAQEVTTLPSPSRAREEHHAVPFWRHFFCGLGQLLSLVFVLNFFALQWLAPYLTYTVLVEEEFDFLPAVVGALASLVLLYPVMLLLAIGFKWVIIGRYKPGSYPLWGWYYFRFWLVTSIEAAVPVSYLSGSPFLSVYLRLMGARIGKDVFLQSDNFAIYDLLNIGDHSSVNVDANLLGYSIQGGRFHVGRIEIGERCFVGTRATLAHGTSMAPDGALEELSLLEPGQRIGPGETWSGSPARPRGGSARVTDTVDSTPTPTTRCLPQWALAGCYAAGLMLFPTLVVGALFPGIALMNHLNYIDPYYWYLFLSPLVGVSFVGLLCLEIVALKWLVLGRIKPGDYPLRSFYHVRKWFVDKTLELSLDVVGPLYASVYLSPWYKALGATIGRGAEISTASFISPDLLEVGPESFIADNASLGAPRVRNGTVSLGHNRIGRRAFIGNSALLPPGTVIGDDVLIGCLSTPPSASAALQADSAWIGSPALFLKQRLKSHTFAHELMFDPPKRLRAMRAAIEFVRVISPSTSFIILTSLLFSALLLLRDHFTLARTLVFFPGLYLACGLAAAAATVLAKWLLVGRYRQCERPLWSTFVWRNELVNALHDHLAAPFLINALTGTPFIAWYLRLLGARIGRRVYIETSDFSEFDLARVGDEAELNADCTIQTHLFEDRVMKMSVVDIGSRCSVGAGSLVLYDTCMDAGSTLGPLSLLMKGEVLPVNTAWSGIPARAHE